MQLLISLLLDLVFGDPPNRFHPTAWMGSAITTVNRFRPRSNPPAEFAFGLSLTVLGAAFVGGIGFFLARGFDSLPPLANWLATALILKTTFSLRGLDRAAREVQSALEAGNLPEARRLLSWHLVSRDTSQLTEFQVAAAAIESVAENASDGIVAPLFFFAIGGLPAALAYRFVNTADSMLGYRDAEREWLGKFPARLDDLLNFIPARLTGFFIVVSAFITDACGRQAWNVMRRDARLTASPNAGVPMSAMAGALGVELEKVDTYVLGRGLRAPQVTDLQRARRILIVSALLAVLTFGIVLVWYGNN
ncbi:MAG: cobalamin biosynthesis protein [Chloroflexi bacterium]|nr:cobalamin biosynthesis protein [Chloroflexota bacterium]